MRPLVLTKESNVMKNRYRKPILTKKPSDVPVIKLQVDYRTVISVTQTLNHQYKTLV